MYTKIIKELNQIATPQIAEHSKKFFKTWPWEYGEWDKFLGIRVPELRKIAKKNIKADFDDISKLIENEYHEVRLVGLFLLVYQFEKVDSLKQKEILEFYMNNLKGINNWDLIDTTTPHIVWKYLFLNPDESRDFLYDFAKSDNLWKRRISIMATQAFIREKQFLDTLKLSEILLGDEHDLIHKAVWWMLREVGNRDEKVLLGFLDKYSKKMPRTMLRYAIERLEENVRKDYMRR